MKKDLLLQVEIINHKKILEYKIQPMIPHSLSDTIKGDYNKDLGIALAEFKRLGIPATDWEIENRARAMGFKSTEELLKESAKIIQKTENLDDLRTKDEVITSAKRKKYKSKLIWIKVSDLFGRRILL